MSIDPFIPFAQDLLLADKCRGGSHALPGLAKDDESGVWCALAVCKVRPELAEAYLDVVIPGDTVSRDGLHRLMVRMSQEAPECLPMILEVGAKHGIQGSMVGSVARTLLLQSQAGSEQATASLDLLMVQFDAATRHDLNGKENATTLIHLIVKHIHSQAMLMRYSCDTDWEKLHDWGLGMVRRAMKHGGRLDTIRVKDPNAAPIAIQSPLLMAVRHYTNPQVRPVAIQVLLEVGACPEMILDHNLGSSEAREILERHPQHIRKQLGKLAPSRDDGKKRLPRL